MDRKFTDTTGRVWRLRITVGDVKRIREQTGFDVNKFGDAEETLKLVENHLLIAEILVVVCQDQMATDGITQDQFEDALDGDVLETAADQLIHALVDWLPKSKGQLVAEWLAKVNEATDSLNSALSEPIQNLDTTQIAKKVANETEAQLKEWISGESLTSPQESSV